MSDTPSKYGGGGGKPSSLSSTNGFDIISFGKVVSVDDPTDSGNIKVRIDGVDSPNTSTADLPNTFPLIPKHLNVTPRTGELVFIIKSKVISGGEYEQRYYIGPIISQPQFLDNDQTLNSKSALPTGAIALDAAPSVNPEAKGIYPTGDEIALQGRDNADILFKKGEVLVRAGKFVTDQPLQFNNVNPGYIQIKSNVVITPANEDTKQVEVRGTVTNIVADKINLLSHKGNPSFPLAGQGDYISDEVQQEIFNKTQPVVFGGELVTFIKLVQEYIKTHTHNYHGMPSVQTELEDKIIKFQTDNLLSKNIRIN
jgi:hypothetical protein